MPVFYLRKYCFGLALMAVLVSSTPMAHAQVWVGSTGTVDPNSTNLVKYINGRVELRNDAPVGSVAFIRYNVLPVGDLAQDLSDIEYRIFERHTAAFIFYGIIVFDDVVIQLVLGREVSVLPQTDVKALSLKV